MRKRANCVCPLHFAASSNNISYYYCMDCQTGSPCSGCDTRPHNTGPGCPCATCLDPIYFSGYPKVRGHLPHHNSPKCEANGIRAYLKKTYRLKLGEFVSNVKTWIVNYPDPKHPADQRRARIFAIDVEPPRGPAGTIRIGQAMRHTNRAAKITAEATARGPC